MAIDIVDLPIKNGESFHSYVNVYQRVAMIQLLQPRSKTHLHQVCEDLFPSTTAGGRAALGGNFPWEQGRHHPWNVGFHGKIIGKSWEFSWEFSCETMKIWEHALHLGF